MAGRIAYMGNIATQGLVLNLDAAIKGSYPGTGSLWTDISNNGNNGTLTNGPLYTGSDYGAIVFDGTNDYVTGSVINTPNQLSVFCFKNPKPKTGTVYPVYIAKWSAEPPTINNRSWLIGIQPGGVEYIAISSNGLYENNTIKRFEFSSSLSNNIWTQVGFTFNNGTLVPYLNGAPTNYTASLNANITSIYTSSIGYTLGYSKDGIIDLYYSGSIATTQIYNQSLSQFQVWQNFNAYKSRYGIPDIVTDGLVLNLDAGNPYSYLSGSSGTTWTNTVAASSSISGSLINGTTYSNGAMTFDGVDDYIQCPVNNALNFCNSTSDLPFSTSVWCYINNLANSFTLYNKGDNGNGYLESYTAYVTTSGLLGITLYDTDGSNQSISFTTSTIPTITWVNLTIVYSGTGGNTGLSLYVNGLLQNKTNSGVGTYTRMRVQNTNLYLGSFGNTGTYSSTKSNGRYANFLFYNRALTQAEITQNFNALRGRYGI